VDEACEKCTSPAAYPTPPKPANAATATAAAAKRAAPAVLKLFIDNPPGVDFSRVFETVILGVV
jgi:hypothetical protein